MNYEYLMKDTEQSILETLKNHEDRINENTENIEDLKKMGEKLADKESKTHVDIEGLPDAIQAKFDQNKKWHDYIVDRNNLLERTNKKIAQNEL